MRRQRHHAHGAELDQRDPEHEQDQRGGYPEFTRHGDRHRAPGLELLGHPDPVLDGEAGQRRTLVCFRELERGRKAAAEPVMMIEQERPSPAWWCFEPRQQTCPGHQGDNRGSYIQQYCLGIRVESGELDQRERERGVAERERE
jgi:hypothetical protein